jgi:hypothetical protein
MEISVTRCSMAWPNIVVEKESSRFKPKAYHSNEMFDSIEKHEMNANLMEVFDGFIPLSHQTVDKSECRISGRILWRQNESLFMKIDGFFVFPIIINNLVKHI